MQPPKPPPTPNEELRKRFDAIGQRLDSIESSLVRALDRILTRLDRIEARLAEGGAAGEYASDDKTTHFPSRKKTLPPAPRVPPEQQISLEQWLEERRLEELKEQRRLEELASQRRALMKQWVEEKQAEELGVAPRPSDVPPTQFGQPVDDSTDREGGGAR